MEYCILMQNEIIAEYNDTNVRISTEKHEDKLDKDGEAGEVSSRSQPPELQEPTSSSDTTVFGWCQLFKVSIS